MSLLIDNMDESVGEMLPQVGLDGQPLTREYYIKEWENGSDIDNNSIDYISNDTRILLSSINEMKYKLYAIRLRPFTEDNYRKEFDITRNLISLELKLRDVLKRSDENTKDAIDNYMKKKSIERSKDINRLTRVIDDQEIRKDGIALSTLVEADVLHNDDPGFIIADTENKSTIPHYELSLTTTDDIMGKYPVNYKTIMNYIEVFKHISSSSTNLTDSPNIVIFNRPDNSILLVGYSLLEKIPATFKDTLNKYKSVAIGKYQRIISEVCNNNPYKDEIRVECSRCPKTGSFYIYLIMIHIEYPDSPYEDSDYIESYVYDDNNTSYSDKISIIEEEVDMLKNKLEISKKMYYKTGEIGYKNRIQGLTYLIEKKEEELENTKEEEKNSKDSNDDTTKKDKKSKEDDSSNSEDNTDTSDNDNSNENNSDTDDSEDKSDSKPKKKEKKDDDTHIDKDIQEYIDKLTEKGYKIRYAYSGKAVKKDDDDKSLNSDARIMFDNKYPFEDAPEGWELRDVDKCSYLDVNTPEDESDSDDDKSKDNKKEDKSFDDWKQEYLNNLNTWIENLPDSSKEGSKKEEDPVTEALLDDMDLDYCYDLMIESIKDFL